MARYDVRTVSKIKAQIEELRDASQDSLDNEENKDYPSDDRIDMLSSRIEQLEAAIEALEELENV